MPKPHSLKTLLVCINLIGILLFAVWLRCRSLENIPGINGDEAWYGVQAVEMLRGAAATWQTPTGNPLNPFFIGPLIILHTWFAPSILLLRGVAVAGGLLALVMNWTLCRWIYDCRTAWISTVVLAILPIDIAYSRFAWDASQSLAATLPVVYFSLAAIRFPQWNVRFLSAAFVCQVLAVIVHPTNIFASPFIFAAVAALWKPGDLGMLVRRLVKHPFLLGAATVSIMLVGILLIWNSHAPIPHILNIRLQALLSSNDMLSTAISYPRLFTGGTIYRYIAGSRSWFEWPLAADGEGFGLDVLVFWLLIVAAVTFLWRSWKRAGRLEDGVLIAGWLLSLTAFLVFAGPRALSPGQERFAICLIAPAIVLLCRALLLVCTWQSSSSQTALLVMSVICWFVPADFQVHYFQFIEQTGGQAHLTFRTGPEEPKAAAFEYILKNRTAGETWIVAGEWWNYWPLKYFSTAEKSPPRANAGGSDNKPR